MDIRVATTADCAAIAAIWNPIIRDTACTFTSQERPVDGLAHLLTEKAQAGLPFLVALYGGQVCGFATYGQFRPGPGYAHTMEHTVMLAPDRRQMGTGRALMAALEGHAKGAGVHSLWAGISGENPGAVAFHAAIGFNQVATLPQVGRKFGRWMDLILMQKFL